MIINYQKSYEDIIREDYDFDIKEDKCFENFIDDFSFNEFINEYLNESEDFISLCKQRQSKYLKTLRN